MIQKRIFLLFVVVGILISLGMSFMFGLFIQPEVHLFSYEFEHKGEFAVLNLRFESKSGVFTAGQPIKVNAFLTYSFNTTDNAIHLLYIPESFVPNEYQKLLKKENFGKMTREEDGSGFSFDAAPAKHLYNLGNFPPEAEFDAVWTQEGPKDAILIMDAESLSMSDEKLQNDGMVIEKIITIQSSDVKQQMQSNNISIGLGLIITAITILTGAMGLEKISFDKNNIKRKK